MTIEEIRQMLRAASQKLRKEGEQAGREWAATQAQPAELQRLAGAPMEGWQFEEGCASYEFIELIEGNPDHWPDSNDVHTFWGGVGCKIMPDDQFVEAFVDGALEFWNSKKARV